MGAQSSLPPSAGLAIDWPFHEREPTLECRPARRDGDVEGRGALKSRRLAVTAAALTAGLGFGVLTALWFAIDWKIDDPGLFDYRSATIGYGLLLPLLFGLLVAALQATDDVATVRDRRVAQGAAALGAFVAAGIQLSWLLDPDPAENWSFPEAHQFNVAGVYHALFLIAAFATAASLLAVVASRVRRLDTNGVRTLVSDTALSVFVGTSIALAGLVLVDNERAAGSQAGITTTVAVVVAALVVVGAIRWAFKGQIAPHAIGLAWGVVGGLGLVALAAHGLETTEFVGTVAMVTAVFIGVGATAPFAEGRGLRWGAVGATTLAIAGAAAAAIHLAPDRGSLAAGAVAMGVIGATTASGLGTTWSLALLLRALATAFCLGTLTWAAWLEAEETRKGAEQAYNAVAVLFEVLVLVLIRDRLKGLVRHEDETLARELRPPRDDAEQKRADKTGLAAWAEFVGFAAPALLTALAFLIAAAPLLGSDAVAPGSARSPLDLLVPGGVLGLSLAGFAAALVWLRRAPERPARLVNEPVAISVRYAIVLAIGGVVYLVFLGGELGDTLRLEGLGVVLGLLYAVVCLEDLRASAGRIQLMDLGLAGWITVTAAAAVQAGTLFWLITSGLWDDAEPASVGSMAVTMAGSLILGYLFHTLAGLTVAGGIPGEKLTPQSPALNVSTIGLLYVCLAIIGAVVPAFVVGRIEAVGNLANSGTVVLGSVFIVPSLIAAYFWLARETVLHARRERDNPVRPSVWDLAGGDAKIADHYERIRLRELNHHVRRQLGLTAVFLAVGAGYTAFVAI